LRQAGVSNGPATEDAGGLAKAESGLRHRLEIRPARDANTTAGAATFSRSIEPTTLGVRERPVRRARRRFHWGYEHTNPGCRERPSALIFMIQRDFPADFPFPRKRPVPASRILTPEQATMHLEFHQLDRRWEHLRVREPQRQRRLLASLADSDAIRGHQHGPGHSGALWRFPSDNISKCVGNGWRGRHPLERRAALRSGPLRILASAAAQPESGR
jgi:hypothetical protein